MRSPFFFLAILSGILISLPAQAYIDPGTTGTVGGALAAILPAILVVFGFLVRPIKKAVVKIFRKKKPAPAAPAPAAEDNPKTDA